jgi:lysophospholipase L1-like esterase
LVIASVVVALLVVEVAFRLYLRHQQSSDFARALGNAATTDVQSCRLGDIVRFSPEPDLLYELKPNLHGNYCGAELNTNAIGMRMRRDPDVAKPPHVFRVVGLGDSFLFGQGVGDGQGFLEVLQARAIAKGVPEEMLDFGVPGYDTWMEAVVLRTKARRFSPDVIVVSVIGNDWDLPNFMLSRPYGDLAHSFVLGALAERFRAPPALLETPRSHVYDGHYLAVPEEVPERYRHMVGFEGYRGALAGMLAVAKEIDARVVLFSDCIGLAEPGSPTCAFPYADGQYEALKREVYDDPRVILCPWHLTPDLLIPRDGHPTPAGHVRLADQLAPCLERAGLPPLGPTE